MRHPPAVPGAYWVLIAGGGEPCPDLSTSAVTVQRPFPACQPLAAVAALAPAHDPPFSRGAGVDDAEVLAAAVAADEAALASLGCCGSR